MYAPSQREIRAGRAAGMAAQFSEQERRAALAIQQDAVKSALQAAATKSANDNRQQRRRLGLALLCLLLGFSIYRIVKPRAQPARVQAAAELVVHTAAGTHRLARRPLPRHILALRTPSDLRLVEDEESLHRNATNGYNASIQV